MPFSVCLPAYAVPSGESALGYTGAGERSDLQDWTSCKMCDCFNQLFGVTWSPTSPYGIEEDRLERHVASRVSETSPVKVREKYSPLKQRSPPAGRSHLSLEEIKDADRAAQKEKLHEELKKVLLLKGQRNSAEKEEPTMETKVNITEEKLRASELVEVIVETEAHAGMSGISISGGGRDGLFISDVLKDSPAAKNLSLQEGDQIISARVYFENIKYEDALKILQYAEHYKVSYCLKRTVPSGDVSISPGSGNVEVKGPKAKMPKMTVKSLTPVKKKKKKLSAKDSDVSVEAVKGSELSAASMDIPPVDVEFSLPNFSKLLKTKGGGEAEATGKVASEEQRGLKLKFPRFRLKEGALGKISTDESKTVSAKAEAEVKDKSSGKFGISVPKIKKPKVDVTVSKPEIGVSGTKSEAKEETIFQTPQVELDIPLPVLKTESQWASEGGKVPGASPAVKLPEVEIKLPTGSVEVEAPEAKFSIPQLPKVGICTPRIDKEQDIDIQVDGRPKTEIKLPSVEIAAPKLDVDFSLPKVEGAVEVEPPETTSHGFQIKLPKFTMSSKAPESGLKATPPQVKKDIEVKVSDDKLKMPSLKMPHIGISLPKASVEGDSTDGQHRTAIKLPSLEISAPKVDVDVSVPKLATADVDQVIEIPDLSLKMPQISPTKVRMKVKDAYAARAPKTDFKTEKPGVESTSESPDLTLHMPKISLPKVSLSDEQAVQAKTSGKGEDEEIHWKGPKIKLPSFGIPSFKEKLEADVPEKESADIEGKLKFPSVKIPSVDISLPKVPDIEPGKLEVSAPTARLESKMAEQEGLELSVKMPKISLPKLDISGKLKKPDASPTKIGTHISGGDTKAKGEVTGKVEKHFIPELDISIPKIKPVELGTTSPKYDGGISLEKTKIAMKLPKVESDAIAFDGKHGDYKLGLPSITMPSLEIDAPSLDVDLNLPKMKLETNELVTEGTESKFQMPKLNLPKLSEVAKDMAVELDVPKITGDLSLPHFATDTKGPGFDIEDKVGKMSLPKVEIGLGKVTELEIGGVELKEKSVKPPKVKMEKPDAEDKEHKMKLPSVKIPSLELTTPSILDADVDASMPKVAIELAGKARTENVPPESDAKWKAPKFSLRKFGISGPKIKKSGEVDIKPMDKEQEKEVAIKGPKIKMPKFGITFPKAKQDVEGDKDLKASKGKTNSSVGKIDMSTEGKLILPSVAVPTVDISAPSVELPKFDISAPSVELPKFDMSAPSVELPPVEISAPSFELPKFDISATSVELPTVDISAPKLDVDIAMPCEESQQKMEKPTEINIDIPDIKLNLPKFSLPKFGKGKGTDVDTEFEKAKVEAKISPSKKSKTVEASSEVAGSSVKGRELKMKMPVIKIPSFGISKKDVDVSEAKTGLSHSEDKTKAKAAAQETKVSKEPKEDDGKLFIKMPTFEMSSPEVKAPKLDMTLKSSEEDLRMPDVHMKLPQVTLPSFGLKTDPAANATIPKTEAKISKKLESSEVHISDKVKLPSLEISAPTKVPELHISVPCAKPDICTSLPKAEVDVSDVDIKRYEGDLKIPKLPSIDLSVPGLELDIGLPKASMETTLERETANIMPKVELPKFGEREAKVDISTKGSKIKMPHVDISLPKIRLDEEDIPFIESEMKMHGSTFETSSTEAAFNLPSVELSKISAPKIRPPELELDIGLNKDDIDSHDVSKTPKAELKVSEGEQHDLKLKMPKIKLPKFGGGSSEDVKVSAKTSKQEDGSESSPMGFKIKLPKVQVGSFKGKGDVEKEGDHKVSVKGDTKVSDHEDSENGHLFRIKMPSFGTSKSSTDSATEPLHPSEESTEVMFKMPKISLPDVGFTGGDSEGAVSLESGQASTIEKIKSTTSSSIENLEIDLGLKMPKIKMPTIGLPGRKGDEMDVSLEEESEAKRSLLKMPDVELFAPKIKAHGEYEVDSANVDIGGGSSPKKSSKAKEEHKQTEEDSERKSKVKLPKFGISLPKVAPGNVELSAPKLKLDTKHDSEEYHDGKKAKKTFSLSKTKDKNASLFTSDINTNLEVEAPDVKIKLPKIKMKPSFGRSRGKGKGEEVNGESEASISTDAYDGSGRSSKIRFPKLGFSSSKTNSGEFNVNGTSSPGHVNGEKEVSVQNGSQDGVGKVGKLRFPKVEFSSPYKGKEIDSEMNLKLVKKEELDSNETNQSLFSGKFKSPKIAFSGFKKKEKGEYTTTAESTEEGDSKSGRGRISLGFLSSKSKGEYTVDNTGIEETEESTHKDKSTKYKIPKLSLGSKSGTEADSSTDTQKKTEEGSQEGFKISLPQVSFTTHQEEQITKEEETTLGFLKVTTTKQITTETVTEKTLAI
ncbi:periaxin [Hyperolius riggenbachi]|uniref:periaxin n=1 Tax=Hyperolius riggenbachi TaxID=752182 RepID=UPI0035A3767D